MLKGEERDLALAAQCVSEEVLDELEAAIKDKEHDMLTLCCWSSPVTSADLPLELVVILFRFIDYPHQEQLRRSALCFLLILVD